MASLPLFHSNCRQTSRNQKPFKKNIRTFSLSRLIPSSTFNYAHPWEVSYCTPLDTNRRLTHQLHRIYIKDIKIEAIYRGKRGGDYYAGSINDILMSVIRRERTLQTGRWPPAPPPPTREPGESPGWVGSETAPALSFPPTSPLLNMRYDPNDNPIKSASGTLAVDPMEDQENNAEVYLEETRKRHLERLFHLPFPMQTPRKFPRPLTKHRTF
jgi:hypothetical protein